MANHRDSTAPGSELLSPERMHNVLISEMRASHEGFLKATLGSCVGIAIVSPLEICGLAHCLLPYAVDGRKSADARYCDQAVENLLRLMRLEVRRRARAYLAGGAKVIASMGQGGRPHIGELNLIAARAALREAGLPIQELDSGGEEACEITVDCATGTVTSRRIRNFSTPVFKEQA